MPTTEGMIAPAERSRKFRVRVALLVFLMGLTLVYALMFSKASLIGFDENLSLWTDRQSTLADVLRMQRFYPIALDPPVYHFLAHLSMKLFGVTALALRLPSIVSVLATELFQFLYLRRFAGYRVGLLGVLLFMAVPLRTFVQGRPYGVLLGLTAASLFFWQSACLAKGKRQRAGWLCALALALVFAINTHYFGVLVFAAFACTEILRSLRHRRMDWPMAIALVCASTGVLFLLAFRSGLEPYSHAYYARTASVKDVLDVYAQLLQSGLHSSLLVPAVLYTGLTIFLAVRFWKLRGTPEGRAMDQWLPLICLALIPIFAFITASRSTHLVEVRFVTPAEIGLVALLALCFGHLLRSELAFRCFALAMLPVIVLGMYHGVRWERNQTHMLLTGFESTMTSGCRTALQEHPDEPIYSNFPLPEQYLSDESLKSRIVLYTDAARERYWSHIDTVSIQVRNMKHIGMRVEPWGEVANVSNPLLLVNSDPSSWAPQEFRRQGRSLHGLGACLGRDMVRVGPPQIEASNRTGNGLR